MGKRKETVVAAEAAVEASAGILDARGQDVPHFLIRADFPGHLRLLIAAQRQAAVYELPECAELEKLIRMFELYGR